MKMYQILAEHFLGHEEEWDFSAKGKTRQNEGKNVQKSTRN